MKTRLGWTLQGPSKFLASQLLSLSLEAELFSNVQKLCQMDTLPYRSEKVITRSKAVRMAVRNVQRYATLLLWKNNLSPLQSDKDAVTAHLRRTEKRLLHNLHQCTFMNVGYIAKVTPEKRAEGHCVWYIPHHIVQHNEKHRIHRKGQSSTAYLSTKEQA